MRGTPLTMCDWGLAPPSGRMLNLYVSLPATTNLRDASRCIPSRKSSVSAAQQWDPEGCGVLLSISVCFSCGL
ncbi:hypothetical protein BO71DRAFT_211062 [Aspergillus ellipticus CBS 707.79]|uniref:Uncharacterized protein n=1 Tax=Aspergillus ellipticus CBS 707.79 TaxID=1448320 RepID=A0A319DCN0_9EURO|nr:hypothetical protein BO71DRAFT_211062 [Aspergillus ellipticus CBS 707.79]